MWQVHLHFFKGGYRMEKVINRLFEIEEKANHILEHANAEKVTLSETLNANLETLKEEIESDTNQKISALQETMNEEIETERQAQIESCKKQILELELTFHKEHDRLVEQVFQKITKA